MTTLIELHATCPCGATVTSRASDPAEAQRIIERWLERHAACQAAT